MAENSVKKIMKPAVSSFLTPDALKIVPIISFETGGMYKDEIEAVFESMPFDITYADKDGIVTYFNRAGRRIFARTQSDIGKTAQQCFLQAESDPLARVEKVRGIISDLKAGKKSAIELCVNSGNHLIHVRYFAVRDRAKSYAGCIEIMQDITEIKKIEEKK